VALLEPPHQGSINGVDQYLAADGTTYKLYSGPTGNGIKEVNCPTRNILHVPGKYHEHYRNTLVESEIPQNIKHKFRLSGLKSFDLTRDQLKVHDTLTHIQNGGIIKKNDKIADSQFQIQIDNTAGANGKLSDYYDLGNHLRHAIAHGYPTVHEKSHNGRVYNEDVSKQFLDEAVWSENVQTPWRKRKDWIGKWTDKDIIDRQNNKGLAARASEKAKAPA
jgi:hypothetical protein